MEKVKLDAFLRFALTGLDFAYNFVSGLDRKSYLHLFNTIQNPIVNLSCRIRGSFSPRIYKIGFFV